MVSEGMIDYTITEQNVAKLNSSFYDNLDYSLSLSVKQKITVIVYSMLWKKSATFLQIFSNN